MAKRILAVEDSKTMLEMVSFTLKKAGFDVLEAEDGKAALSALEALTDNIKVDVIITDINMPNMNGFELIRSLRSNPAYKFTPILILTTESDVEKKQEGKASGATGWIVKPFNPEKLVAVVNKVCS